MKKFGLIGHPLSHSFSSAFFTKKFATENIDAVYENFPIETLDELPLILKSEPELVGLNVTIPFKTSIIKLLDDIDEEAKFIQAVNTIAIERVGDCYKLHGHNTDVIGFRESILPHLQGHEQALILGTGGVAKAAYHVLSDLDIECELVSRNPELGDYTYEELTADDIWAHTIIINCSPVGMHPDVTVAPQIPYDSITPEHLLFDMIYNPSETVFLRKGKIRGATTINGLEMLERQAEESWKIWNNID
ncbi:MAG: shikimate dehydrogenase [Flavobacteriales bacterium]|nr:shikimate dehydrogenase [Flavobacteriales bacterium]